MKYFFTLLGIGAFIALFLAFEGGMFTPIIHFNVSVNSIGAEPIRGNGGVVEDVREVAYFNKIKSSSAIEVILQKGDSVGVIVVSDSNLLDRIKTDVVGEELRLYIEKGVEHYKELKVLVTYTELVSLRTGSASNIFARNSLVATTLHLRASGASSIVLDSLFVNDLRIDASSAARVEVSGEGKKTMVKVSSASKANLQKFKTEDCDVSASSASSAKVFPVNLLKAKARFGSSIYYYGTPLRVEEETSKGGFIKQKSQETL